VGVAPRIAVAGLPQPMNLEERERARATLALALLSLIWGYNWVAMKIGLAYAGPFDFSALRFTLASACLLPFILFSGERPLPARGERLALALLGVMLAANFGLTMTALKWSGVGRIAVIVYTMPFWVLLFARIVLDEKLSRLQVLAVYIAAAGLVALVAPWQLGGAALAGLMAAAAGASWGASVVYVKTLQKRGTIGSLQIAFWQMVVAAPLLGAVGWAFDPQPVDWGIGLGLSVAYVGVLATGVAWMLFYYALRRLTAGLAGLGTLSTPVIGAVAAWLHLGERPLPLEFAGMALIVFALAMLSLPQSR
jgi:drug/metabolite transporter (DMT)-like permease